MRLAGSGDAKGFDQRLPSDQCADFGDGRATIVPGDHGPELIDDPRTAASELWQVTQPPPRESDVSRSVTRKRRGWLVPVGAAAATILAAGALVFATYRTPPEPPSVPGIVPAGPARLIVRDGDLVAASGPVEDAELCAPAPTTANVGGDTCPYGIRVPGVRATDGATLRGRWHPGRLSAIRRMPYSPTSAGVLGDSDLPDTPPCPAPAGGWSGSEDWLPLGLDEPVDDYLRRHADQFAEPFATHSGNARILVVEVVSGDVDQARAALTAIYPANLCVVTAPGGHSIAAENKLQATTGKAIGALMNDEALGIYLITPEHGKLRVNMLQLTQPLYDKLAAIGLDHLILDPWIRPASR
ncbi:hypothetical protein AB0368_07215 [Actinoplanes sp. NPDC051475]|uniref:hypothetical protein n=1 Tax=Actinoplanes sp. NPDC051475 TaxID=3157225 RepID=UPI0034503340